MYGTDWIIPQTKAAHAFSGDYVRFAAWRRSGLELHHQIFVQQRDEVHKLILPVSAKRTHYERKIAREGKRELPGSDPYMDLEEPVELMTAKSN